MSHAAGNFSPAISRSQTFQSSDASVALVGRYTDEVTDPLGSGVSTFARVTGDGPYEM